MASILSAAHFHNEEAAYAFIEGRIWTDGRVCPHCGVVDRSGPLKGKSTRIGVYKCYACRKPFTVKVGTVFESSHIKPHIWLQAMHLLTSSTKGTSTNQLSRILGVSLQSAWFLSHRIREAMKELHIDDSGPLGGQNKVVEVDETYVGGKAKNRKNRAPPKETVLALVERKGKVRSRHVADVTGETLCDAMTSEIDKASYVMTDEAPIRQNRRRICWSRHSQPFGRGIHPRLLLARPTRLKVIFRSCSADSSAPIITSARSIFIAILWNLISATTSASRLALMAWRAPTKSSKALLESGSLMKQLVRPHRRGKRKYVRAARRQPRRSLASLVDAANAGANVMVDPIPLVHPVRLDGPGPFQLPRLQGAASFLTVGWESPVLSMHTKHGCEVHIPLELDAIHELSNLLHAWLISAQNPRRLG